MTRYGLVALWVLLVVTGQAQGRGDKAIPEDRRIAPDHVTEGWLLSYDSPDPNRSWERITGTLVLARHGKIIRRIDVDSNIRNWAFWRGGMLVAIEEGGLHGPTACFLTSVRSGKKVAKVAGSCDIYDDAAPAWVWAMRASAESHGGDPPR